MVWKALSDQNRWWTCKLFLKSANQKNCLGVPVRKSKIHKSTNFYKYCLTLSQNSPKCRLGKCCNVPILFRSIYIFFFCLNGGFLHFFLFLYDIQHCFIWHPSDSTVSEDAGIEPRTIATTALAVRRSNHSARVCICWLAEVLSPKITIKIGSANSKYVKRHICGR